MSDYEIKTGERYAQSPVTGAWYLITKWEDYGDGKILAREKEEIDESEVPPEIKEYA